jgi:hypothetical protein
MRMVAITGLDVTASTSMLLYGLSRVPNEAGGRFMVGKTSTQPMGVSHWVVSLNIGHSREDITFGKGN